MRIKSLLRLAIILAAGWALLAPAFAYVLIRDASGVYVITWPPGYVPIQVKLSQAATLSDGNSQASSVLAAMQSWNAVLGTVQLAGTVADGTYALDNAINEIAMDTAIDGESFDSGTLAVTLSASNGNTRTESDIVFNRNFTWDSYRGSLRVAEDIQRVALHELGHVLGLTHPDEYGQAVSAIMNSHESSVYTLLSDDINGAQKLYGSPGFKPVNDNFANATVLVLPGNSLQVTGTNVGATREPGETNHVGVAQGHSVWWKWTAPSSGSVSVSTYGSNYDTVMSVYTGTAVNALTLVGENDDEEPSAQFSGPGRKRTSLVTFNAVDGVTYYVAVDGWGNISNNAIPYSGAITLTVNFGGAVPPVISTQPGSKNVYEGDLVTFSVYATSVGSTLNYRWQWLPNGTTNWVSLSDAGNLSGSTSNMLWIDKVLIAGSGDQFRCVITNSSGGTVTSDAATLTVKPLPLPTVGELWISTDASSYTAQIFSSASTPGGSAITYQWYHNGATIPGQVGSSLAVPAIGGAELGEYYVAVTTSAGTVLSPTKSLTVPAPAYGTPPDYNWTKAVETDGVVYFLFKSPAQIARYDLNSEAWLPAWPLAQAASDLVIAQDAIYLATGTNVTRYDRSFGSPSALITETKAIVALIQSDNFLVTIVRQYSDTTFTSYNRITGQKVASVTQSYALQGDQITYGPATHRIYGSTTGSPAKADSIMIGGDGAISGYISSPQGENFPRVDRLIVLPGGALADTGGIVYNGNDLTYQGSLGGLLTDLVSDGAGGYYVLRRGKVSAVDSSYRETGVSNGHLKEATRMWRRNNVLYLFAQPTASGAVPAVEKMQSGAFPSGVPVAAADPAAASLISSQWLIDEQGVVYIYSKLDRNIYRWSAQTKSFLPSIPLVNSPNYLVYSAENRALYLDENDYQIRRIPLDTGDVRPVPAGTAPLALTGLETAGNLLWLGMNSVQLVSRTGLILNSAGSPLRFTAPVYPSNWNAWCPPTRRMYSVSGGLTYYQIDAAGAWTAFKTSSGGNISSAMAPIRVSADGSRVTDGSGQVYDGTSLVLLGTLANAYADAAWTTAGLHTVRNVGGATELQSWSSDTWRLKADRAFPGIPLRLLTLPDGKLLLGTLLAGKLNLRVIEPDTFAVLSGPPVSTKTAQSITFGGLADATYGDALVTLGATASSGLPVSYNVVSGPATVSGGTVVLTGAGTVVIRASQAGDSTYEAAISVARSFTVRKPLLRAAAADQTRIYGVPNPTLSVVYSGFIGKDTEAVLTYKPRASTTASTSSVPGNYPITLAGGVSDNYDFVYTSGTLTVTKAPLTVKADNIVRAQGAENPPLTLTYAGFGLGDGRSSLTERPVATTAATIDSPVGLYPITVTGGFSDIYEIIRVNGTLTITPPSYNRTYFGTLASSGYWALQVRIDGTATYLAYLPGRTSAVVTELTVATDGSFSVTGTETKRTAQAAGVSALALASPETPVIHTGAAAGDFILTGQITANGAVTGALGGLGETFTGAAEPATGPAQALVGYYRAAALNTATGATHVIVGASGQALVVTTTPSAVDGALGTVNADGQLSVTTSSGAALSVAINAASQSVSASLKPAGSSAPITYAGLSNAVVPDARVINLSVRTPAGTGSQTLIVGFVVSGSGSKALLLRGVGPGLLSQGVPNALGDPTMRLLDASQAELAVNNDWGGSAQLAQLFSSLGAFALPSNSKDAALSNSIAPGAYSCHVYPSTTGSGVILAEFYDADTAAPTASVVNLSARTQVGTGGDILIAGFVVAGNAPKTLLIRGVGPTLTALGVGGALADPQLYLYSGSTIIASNDNWGGTAEFKTAFATVGAGALAADTSKDAALLVTLQPGTYTAQLSGVGGTTGVGLVEIYLMP
ncbi:MAG: matrixin family metalloprotease [Verrucomicrobia bacterium]|nr:matrixin family metalloprotease [Verrucomicrobiota bacterium]